MNLNKADRKVFLPPREKTSRTRVPKKKSDDFQDEVHWRVAPCVAHHSRPRITMWRSATSWGSRQEGLGLGLEHGAEVRTPRDVPSGALCGAPRVAATMRALSSQDLEDEGTVLERKQKAAEKKLREGEQDTRTE